VVKVSSLAAHFTILALFTSIAHAIHLDDNSFTLLYIFKGYAILAYENFTPLMVEYRGIVY